MEATTIISTGDLPKALLLDELGFNVSKVLKSMLNRTETRETAVKVYSMKYVTIIDNDAQKDVGYVSYFEGGVMVAFLIEPPESVFMMSYEVGYTEILDSNGCVEFWNRYYSALKR